jgi:hypothetical protein
MKEQHRMMPWQEVEYSLLAEEVMLSGATEKETLWGLLKKK